MGDVQSLVVRAQAGDVAAYEDLVNHYRPIAKRRAENVARNNRKVDVSDVESALMWSLQRCYETYDESTGPFEHYVNAAWKRETMGVIHKAHSSQQAKLVAMSLDTIDDSSSDSLLAIDEEAEALASIAAQDIRSKVRSVDANLEKVLLLVAYGTKSNEEIARACGFIGSSAAAKVWTRRAIGRIRQIVIGDRARVRVNREGSSLHGMTGEIVRIDVGNKYDTIVELSDGRVRSFRMSEIDVIEETI